ncbi:type VI secretion system-associated protein TagF [Rhodanobacter sp. KK11]|uniref:type VI secretion system-associated protein TagF n=1 Tax=Rhodanobacter sp. KK11 TaxID=3083255 RepID=UPI002966E34F|nr:type VI secretion system-associated protein TagF [Rhodanobacter sp. KK11]MDW2982063.1 type VI secretion system-associated protein TagF [Rhodanobacter sp. KK11]
MPNPAAGFFGKLPSAGDFVQRRLPAGFVDVWDRHFENAVAESRSALGSGWHEAYHASPVWRFLLAAGICGESAWAGIMGPGVDRVGRCFPMVIAAPVAGDVASCTRALAAGSGWFDAAAQAHDAAQADAAISVDMFDQQVAALAGPLDMPAPAYLQGVDWNSSSHWRLPLSAGTAAGPFLGDLWARLAAAPGRWCLWWTAGAERVPASVLATNGLPQPAAYAGYLDAGSAASWQSCGVFADAMPRRPSTPVATVDPADLADAFALPPPPPPPSAAWLPDDPELLSNLDAATLTSTSPAPPVGQAAVAAAAAAEGPAAGVAVWHRADAAVTLVAAEAGHPDRRQQAVAAVSAIARELLPAAEPAAGMQALRTRIMALNPQLQQASEDLIDPVLEDCAVVAAQVAGGRAGMLRIGAAVAWHWRQGRLQPCFANGAAPAQENPGGGDDFDDLLFSPAPLATPGLGATAQPACSEVLCAVEPGDRLLLMATHPLLQLSPDVLARGLAMPSRGDAYLHIATAAGLGTDAARWPLAIIEIDA